MPNQLVEIRYKKFFKPSLKNLSLARKFAKKKLSFLGEEKSYEAVLALDELLTDAVYHGIGKDEEGVVIGIFGSVDEKEITLGVQDPMRGESKLSLAREKVEKHRGSPVVRGLGFEYSRFQENGWTVAQVKKKLSQKVECLKL